MYKRSKIHPTQKAEGTNQINPTTHSGPDRDPRGWSVSTLYYALLPSDQVPAVAGSKTEAIAWCDPERPGHPLGFDHPEMLAKALATLRDTVARGAVPAYGPPRGRARSPHFAPGCRNTATSGTPG